ncbi:MAG: hypothetical protein K2P79_10490 [Sphingomonas sp.]|nr:hypothetical protein [Sphingomonas sp.]
MSALPLAAALMLAAQPAIGAAMAPDAIFVALCGDPAHLVPIPLNKDDSSRRHCPMACHAACARRTTDDEE